MKIFEIEEKAKPLYIGVRFDEDTQNKIMEFIKKEGIKKPISKDDIHLTLIYSKKPVTGYVAPKDIEYTGTFKEFKLLGDDNDCLVIVLNSEDFVDRQKELMDDLGASFDYDEYTPHITLSYDAKDFDMTKSSFFKDFEFVAIEEYGEDIDPK